MRLHNFAIILALFCAVFASAQTTTYTGTIKDLTNAAVTSGQVTFTLQPGADTTISGSARFTPATAVCGINGSGAVLNQTLSGACVVVNNTSLSPAGSYYRVQICPSFACTSIFNVYAIGGSIDISTVVPTPGTLPAYSFADTFSNQTIGGNKTFTGTNIFSGSNTFSNTNTFSGVNTFNAVPVFSGGISGTAGQTLGLPSIADTLAGIAAIQTFTGKTYDTAGSGNSFLINGLAATANTGTGAVVRATAPTVSNLTNTGNVTVNNTPSSAWTIDGAQANALVPIANNGTYDIGVGAGLILLSNNSTGSACLFITGGGGVTIVSDPSGVCSVAGGTGAKTNVFYNGSTAYRIENKTGGTVSYYLVMIRGRNAT